MPQAACYGSRMCAAESPGIVTWDQSEPCSDWDPDIQAIFRHWRKMAPAGRLPGRQHLFPTEIVKLLPGVWLLDVQRDPFRLRYRLVGTRVVNGIGRDVTGLWLDDAHPDMASTAGYLDRYRQVVDTSIPSWRRGRPRLSIRLDFEVIENVVLPLAGDGENVDMLLALTVFHHDHQRAA